MTRSARLAEARSVAGMVAFVGTIIGVLGAVMATSLTLMGAHAARKAGRSGYEASGR